MIESTNKEWGFYRSISPHAAASEAWPLAMQAIIRATGFGESAVRDFLDTPHGRHFADEVGNALHDGLALPAAVDAAVEQWMNWSISARMQAQTGIPCGLPYLVGLVGDCEIVGEVALPPE